MTARCSKGWGARCARAKSPTCRCACHGENHGNPVARRKDQQEDEQMKLTDTKIFERAWDEHTGHYVSTDHFLAGAETVADIHLSRTPVGGMRAADGSHLGDALVDIPQRFVVHSPTGFEWGYGGSGPSDLALNILALFVPPPEAWRLHHDYKREVISGLEPKASHTITAASVREWIKLQWVREQI